MDEYFPDYRNFLSALTTASTTIKSLLLQSGELEVARGISCQYLLPRFKRLKHLELGQSIVSSPLAEHLQQLPSLRTLRLAPFTDYDGLTLADLLSVIDGPSRTTSLQVLVVDSLPATFGTGHRLSLGNSKYAASISLLSQGWYPEGQTDWKYKDVELLLEAGRRNGVQVRGSSFKRLKMWRMLKLEEANRLIYRAYHSKSFDEYIAEKAAEEVNPRLPNLDLDKLDLNNLKFVKIDLPEEDWYQVTLE
ncbi:hypothetical protein JCM5350_003928 [Sporobolomyces pararoseus]